MDFSPNPFAIFTRSNVTGEAESIKSTFSSWDNCMAQDYCKWPVVVAIIIAALIVLSIVLCAARCLCCGLECCCMCCSCFNACCPSPRKRSKTNYAPAPQQPGLPPGGQPYGYQAPMNYGGYAPPPQQSPWAYGQPTPQFATFESTAPRQPVTADSLPAMPSWDTSASRKVEVEESADEVAARDADHPGVGGNGAIAMSTLPSPGRRIRDDDAVSDIGRDDARRPILQGDYPEPALPNIGSDAGSTTGAGPARSSEYGALLAGSQSAPEWRPQHPYGSQQGQTPYDADDIDGRNAMMDESMIGGYPPPYQSSRPPPQEPRAPLNASRAPSYSSRGWTPQNRGGPYAAQQNQQNRNPYSPSPPPLPSGGSYDRDQVSPVHSDSYQGSTSPVSAWPYNGGPGPGGSYGRVAAPPPNSYGADRNTAPFQRGGAPPQQYANGRPDGRSPPQPNSPYSAPPSMDQGRRYAPSESTRYEPSQYSIQSGGPPSNLGPGRGLSPQSRGPQYDFNNNNNNNNNSNNSYNNNGNNNGYGQQAPPEGQGRNYGSRRPVPGGY